MIEQYEERQYTNMHIDPHILKEKEGDIENTRMNGFKRILKIFIFCGLGRLKLIS